MIRKISFWYTLVALLPAYGLFAQNQDTITVQTLTYDSAGRNYMFSFPNLPSGSYEKILMMYSMRCKDGLVSDGTNRNKGCGEWDYSSNTFITDSSLTDSTLNTHPSHIISGFSGSTFKYRNTKTYDLIQHNYRVVSGGTTVSESKYPVSTGVQNMNLPGNVLKHHRMQVLYKKSELSGAGFSGAISGISFFAESANGTAKNFRVRIKEKTADSLNPSVIDTAGFTEVFYNQINPVAGENKLLFFQNFNWSGNADLLIEFSYDLSTGANLILKGDANDTEMAVLGQSGGNLAFSGSGWLNINTSGLSPVKERVTFAFWTKGDPAFIPSQNTTFFEGTDNNNNRQVNCHLPWSDKNVYWDCGNDGSGYDRINKVATAGEYASNWKHWIVTKDAVTGRMAIYRDGAIFTQNTGKKKIIDIQKLALGSSIEQSFWYYGLMNRFQMWDTSINQTMAGLMYKNDLATMTGLLPYQKLDIGVGQNGIVDFSANNTGITTNGNVNLLPDFGSTLFHGFKTIPRPKLSLIQGVYNGTVINTETYYDTIYHNPSRVVSYQISDHQPVGVDTTYGYGDSTGTIYNEDGSVASTFGFNLDKTINITTLTYYNSVPQRLELMSFVTPYGIGLDLGMNGKTWQFDVSDFEPVLRGNKYLSMDFGGQFQEEIDIKFHFIKGTPTRKPISIQQIWKVEGRSYQDINALKAYEPRSVYIPANAASAKIRSVISGHGQEGEFIPQNHKLNLNNGQKIFNWDVWKKCADNPVFPQGGTWTFDRAGWCPGMPTDVKESNITPYIIPGETLQVKYSVNNPSGDSRYIANHQLVTYGPMSFANDAALVRISKPSREVEFEKFNPACSTPEVQIKNNGSNDLTAVTIRYWADPQIKLSYTWTGTLKSLQETSVSLPVGSLDFWGTATQGVFYAEITGVNAGDEYSNNNLLQSDYKMPKVHGNKVILNYKTNLYPQENSYKITDIDGNTVASKSGFAASKVYNDTLNLAEGCYKMEFLDNGDDGLYYWYWEAAGQPHGTGYLKFKDLISGTTKTFQPEFGSRMVYEFTVSNSVGINETNLKENIHLFPNPSGDRLINIDLDGYTHKAVVEIFDAMGKSVNFGMTQQEDLLQLDLGSQKAGVYYVKTKINNTVSTHKLILL